MEEAQKKEYEQIEVDKYTVLVYKDIYKNLGEGSYASVYKSYLTKDQTQLFAAKVMGIKDLKTKELEFLDREIQILKEIQGIENLAQVIDVIKKDGNCYFFFKRYEQSLESKLNKENDLKLQDSLYIFSKILNGYQHLHKKNIIHRDLKPSNILLDKNEPYITDFGFAKIYEECDNLTENEHTIIGTYSYMSPQILAKIDKSKQEFLTGNYDINKCDIWSLGIILFEMIYQCKPWEGSNVSKQFKEIKEKNIEEIIKEQNINIPQEIIQLIKDMLQMEEQYRLTFEGLQEDFNEIFEKYYKE